MKRTLAFLLTASFLALPPHARACWNMVDPRAFASRCPVIVTGTITEIETGCPCDVPCRDIALVTVSAVHKNVLKDLPLGPSSVIRVRMAAREAKLKKSTDLRYPLRDKALWLIELDPDGGFSITSHPVQRQPVGAERKVMGGELLTVYKAGVPTGTHTRAEWMAQVKAGKGEQKEVSKKMPAR